MRLSSLLLAPFLLFLVACGDSPEPQAAKDLPPLVRTVAVRSGAAAPLGLSGTVRARVETPLAFQVGGRIARRLSDAGQPVRAGQALFELDARDLEPEVGAAAADLAAAEAALASAASDLRRHRELRTKNFVSAQALERAELASREARTRRDAAMARLAQARNALGYARLQAPADGVLIDVTGEAGQVVAAGEPVALLAQAGEREIEVHFAEGVTPPPHGELLAADGARLPLRLRETAGAVDALGRTLRARYTVLERADDLRLGAVLRTRFAADSDGAAFAVPIGALDERGRGPRVWRLRDGRVTAVAVVVLSVDGDTARIRGPLAVGERLVALGTHLLGDDMAVRELAR
ncbi:efflux RND transporter periplasmic adaptor subunit [Pseudomonas stutzeri]|nr:efflux RND transporter periplasmic adaptor subunit [Stutzerimonas stutzeri]